MTSFYESLIESGQAGNIAEKPYKEAGETTTQEGREWIHKRDVIIEVTTNFMFPLTLLFGLYIMMGTSGTGGGFQGGTILATAFILYITVFGTEMGRKKMPEST
ncbi:MAG: hypothetical protein LUQ47_06215, partial [Methanotrichaceae archaeon]|nr:hypothetical protein [Methanotrichaceae archaeon]